MCKMIKRNCLLFAVLLMLVSISGCGIQDTRLKRDARAYMEMKDIINEALTEYYDMLERPQDVNGQDFEDKSDYSAHKGFFDLLDDADKIADSMKSEEFQGCVELNKKSIESLRYAYFDFIRYCHGMYLYRQDNSVINDEGFQIIHVDSYKDYKKYARLFDEYYSQAQDEEDYLNDEGVFEGLHWDSEED